VKASGPRLLAGLAAIAVLAAGCQGRKERKLAEEVIRRYDRAVIEAHLTGSTAELEKAAGEREAERVQIFVATLRGQRQLLIESLEQLRVREATFEAETGRAVAEERWSYERVDARTRKPVAERTRRDYVMTYLLARRGGEWVVDKVEFARPSKEVAP
jgi:hypothetical protein